MTIAAILALTVVAFAIQMKRLWIELAGESFDLRDADLIRSRSKDLAGAQIF